MTRPKERELEPLTVQIYKRERWHGGTEPMCGWFLRFIGRWTIVPIVLFFGLIVLISPIFLATFIGQIGAVILLAVWIGGLIYAGVRFSRSNYYKARW